MNLETELLKQNRKVVTARELLLIREFETNASVVENDALQRVGLHEVIQAGKQIKEKANKKLAETHKFKQERVFHISQIEGICKKYHLRFLETKYYKGTIDKDLPLKITTFEAAYGVRCGERVVDVDLDRYNEILDSIRAHREYAKGKTYIIAPKESFKLQERPKDPLFFYAMNDEYFYLVHKWGNDLSWFRGFKHAILKSWVTPFVGCFLLMLPVILSLLMGIPSEQVNKLAWFASFFGVALMVLLGIRYLVFLGEGDENEAFSFVDDDNWNNPYRS